MRPYEAKYLEYPSGSRLLRLAKGWKEVWLFENKSLCTTFFYLSLTNSSIGSRDVLPKFDDQNFENRITRQWGKYIT